MIEQRNKALAARFLALISAGEADAAFGLVHGNVEWIVPAKSMHCVMTRDVVLSRLNALLVAANGTFRIWPVAMTAEGERVAIEAESRADFRTGRKYNNTYHFIFVVRDDKIVKVGEYMDSAHVKEVVFPTTSRIGELPSASATL